MLPSVLASELEQVVKDAISTSFHPTTPGFSGLIERFLANRENLIKGPYVTVSLPFKEGSGKNWFPNSLGDNFKEHVPKHRQPT